LITLAPAFEICSSSLGLGHVFVSPRGLDTGRAGRYYSRLLPTERWLQNITEHDLSGSGDRCVFSNVRSAILSAHYGDDVRQRAFGSLARRLHYAARTPAALIEERRRSKKPSPCRAFLPFSEQTERKTR
jgi:hypothetical protein